MVLCIYTTGHKIKKNNLHTGIMYRRIIHEMRKPGFLFATPHAFRYLWIDRSGSAKSKLKTTFSFVSALSFCYLCYTKKDGGSAKQIMLAFLLVAHLLLSL